MRIAIFTVIMMMITICSYAAEPAAITSWTQQDAVYPITPGDLAPQMAGAAIYGDYIYVLGGNNDYDGDTARVFKIKIADKYTGALDPAVEVTSFASADNYSYLEKVCGAYNGYLYVGGGGYNTTGPNRNDVTYNKIVTDGDLDTAWSHSAIFPTTPANYDPELGALVIVNGYLYMMAGDGEVTLIFDRCHYAKIKGDGTLDTWQTGTTLPSACYFASACAVGNDIIMHQGLTTKAVNTTAQDKIYVCQTNPTDGSMGSWDVQTDLLPQTLYGTRLMAIGNTIFVIGGRTSGGTAQNVVNRATYNPTTHTVGPWASTDSVLPMIVRYHDAVYSETSKRIYVVSLRVGATADYNNLNAVWISNALYEVPTPTPTPTPEPGMNATHWEMYY